MPVLYLFLDRIKFCSFWYITSLSPINCR